VYQAERGAVPVSDDRSLSPGGLFDGLDALGGGDLYRSMVEAIPGVLYIDSATDDGKPLYLSPSIEGLLGYTPEELYRPIENWLDRIVYPDDRELVANSIARVLAGSPDRIEYRCVRKDGAVVWVLDDSASVPGDDGRAIAIRGFMVDVTRRKLAEEETRAAEERFRQLVEEIPAIVYVDAADEFGSTIYISPQVEQILGYTSQECLDRPALFIEEIVHPSDRAYVLEGIALDNAGHGGAVEYRCRAKDGRVVWIHDNSIPQFDAAGTVATTRGFMVDVTARKTAEAELAVREEQLRHAQRLESVGRLAGGVAHDFNNLLTVIRGHLDLLLDANVASPDMRDQLLDVRAASDRAAELTGQLLAFSRQQVLHPEPITLADVVAASESMLQRLVPADIALSVRVELDLEPVLADRGQLEQVAVNLVVNARDATSVGGSILVEVLGRELGPDERAVGPEGAYAELRVTDTGHGMDDETRLRIFEPFFTTKEPGRGTGLGLSTVEGIVAQSGGLITVSSLPGEGTSISVLLPLVDRPAVTTDVAHVASAPLGGDETVLVVEDDDDVRRVVRRMLEGLGYDVLEAMGPTAALEIVRSDGKVDLLLTDLVMPGGTGRSLAEEVVRVRPGIGVMLMSGYTDDEIVRRGLLPGTATFLQKPFERDDLARHVRVALDARSA
jgi:two-component system, cell cycle sensor histidine kinase and response regulator CckA